MSYIQSDASGSFCAKVPGHKKDEFAELSGEAPCQLWLHRHILNDTKPRAPITDARGFRSYGCARRDSNP